MMGKKILLVDDDPSVLCCYERLMRRSGYEPVLVPDGRHLLDRVPDHHDADLLIIDFQMPKMNGILLLDRLRERGFLVPVLLISALMSEEERESARRLGVVRVLEKPVETQDLLASIRAIVGPGRPVARGSANSSSAAG